MAVGQVSSISGDNWQLISTTTMAGATSYTVSDLTGYKTLRVAVADCVKSVSDYLIFTLNGNSTAGKYAGRGGTIGFYYLSGAVSAASAGAFTIYDANQSAPHRLEIPGYTATANTEAMYVDPTPITSFTITSDGGTATLNSGTIKVYGIAA